MKKMLSSVGIGSATVDTVLPTTTLTAGDAVDARVDVSGGSTEQEIDGIYFALVTRYRTDDSTKTATIDSFRIADSFTIEPDADRSFSVEIDVPRHTPVTEGRTNVWVKTGLDIDWAVDPKDRDDVSIDPDPLRASLFDAVESLGFSLREAECEAAGGLASRHSFVQEFEFVPRSGPYVGKLDELEVVCLPDHDGFDVLVEVDRRGGLLSEHFDLDETTSRFSLTPGDEDRVEETLRSTIDRHC